MFGGQNVECMTDTAGKNKSVVKSQDLFSGYLNQGANSLDQSNVSSNDNKKSVKAYEGSNDSYDRYQCKKNIIVSGRDVEEKLEQSVEEVENFVKDIVKDVTETLDVTEEEIVEAMQMLGVTVLDLLNPQVLAELTVQLTEMEDTSELLLDSSFQSLLGKIAQTEKKIVQQLDVDADQMVDQMKMLLSKMEVFEQPQLLDNAGKVELHLEETVVLSQEKNLISDSKMGISDMKEAVVSNMEENLISNPNMDGIDKQQIRDVEQENVQSFMEKQSLADEKLMGEAEYESDNGNDWKSGKLIVASDDNSGFASLNEKQSSTGSDHMFSRNQKMEDIQNSLPKTNQEHSEYAFSTHIEQMSGETLDVTPIVSNQPEDVHISIDAIRILEQLAERMRVHNFSEGSSIEMQLNPENLGKMYINISSKQGMVNAQIAATNENVKEALEAQVHELRETLQQSGVKVDAIEVTIASHEFERSLEQGQSREQQEAQQQEEMKEKNRRELNRSSFEEWTDDLSEEEALIVQMMKDNGNSFDYTV